MLTLRQRIFAIGGMVFAVLAIILLFLLFRSSESNNETIQLPNGSEQQTAIENGFVPAVVPTQEQEVQNVVATELDVETWVKQVSRTFVERFATYSNQNNNSHIDDALRLATDSMALWVRTQRNEESLTYSGVTTRVLVSTVRDFTGDTAVVGIDAQQEVRSVKGEASMRERVGRVELVKQNEEWKVNGFFWES